MRRILFAAVTGLALGMLTGCHCCCSSSQTQGICDCDNEDPCYTRAPWANGHGVVGSGGRLGEQKRMPLAELPRH